MASNRVFLGFFEGWKLKRSLCIYFELIMAMYVLYLSSVWLLMTDDHQLSAVKTVFPCNFIKITLIKAFDKCSKSKCSRHLNNDLPFFHIGAWLKLGRVLCSYCLCWLIRVEKCII